MGPITVFRGFKVPIAILDRFLGANGVEPTDGYPPFHHRNELDAGSKFLREKLQATAGDTKTQIFIPQFWGELGSTYVYVAYAWVMVYAQRKLELEDELPNQVPAGFVELRREILGYANGGDLETLQVRRREEGVENPATDLFVLVAEERPYSFQVFPHKVSP
jgi:hypothetical protein